MLRAGGFSSFRPAEQDNLLRTFRIYARSRDSQQKIEENSLSRAVAVEDNEIFGKGSAGMANSLSFGASWQHLPL